MVTLPAAFGVVLNTTFVKNKSYAAYAQASFKLTDTIGVTGGVRYTNDDKGCRVPLGGSAIINGFAGVFGPPGTITPFFAPGSYERSFTNTSFKAGIDWKPTSDLLIYASYAEGFKSGGFNTRYLVPVPSATPTIRNCSRLTKPAPRSRSSTGACASTRRRSPPDIPTSS